MGERFPAIGWEQQRNRELQSPTRTMRHEAPAPKRAAAWARRSSKHPQFSTARQMTVIRNYAKRRGLEIAMAYSDGGKGSGKP
jgi:hypothetical protein